MCRRKVILIYSSSLVPATERGRLRGIFEGLDLRCGQGSVEVTKLSTVVTIFIFSFWLPHSIIDINR